MAIDRVRRALYGISGVHITPYAGDGSVDAAMLKRVVDRIVAAGVHNVVSAGNTAEFFALTPEEVAKVHDAAVAAAAGRSIVTAAVGRSLIEAVDMAKRAGRIGADAVMVHHPLDPFAAPSAQAEYFAAVADASPVPVVAYVRSDAIGPAALARLARHANIAGVKFATTNLMQFAECVRAAEGAAAVWVCGLAEGWAAPFYALGGRGFTSGLVNVMPELSLAIHAALEAGDYARARALVNEVVAFETMRAKHNNGANVTVVKEAMKLIGFDVGTVRRPGLVALDDADRAALRTIVAGWQARHGNAAAAQ